MKKLLVLASVLAFTGSAMAEHHEGAHGDAAKDPAAKDAPASPGKKVAKGKKKMKDAAAPAADAATADPAAAPAK